MKTRFVLTPIAAAVLAFGSTAAFATSHDATKPQAETTTAVPQITNPQTPAVEQRTQAQRDAQTRDATTTTQQGTTGTQRGDAATSGDRRTQSGATAPQTGTKAYGTDVDPNRMRGSTTGQQQGAQRGDATAPQTGTKAYGTDVDPNRMRGDTTGQQQTGTTGATGATGQQMQQRQAGQQTGATARSGQAGQAGMASANWDRKHRATKIIGMDVQNRQGEKVGTVEDIVLDARGNAAYAVVSTGGFLGIGERLHAVPWNSLQRSGAGDNLVVDVDRDRLRNAPGFERNNWPDVTDAQWRQQNQRYWPQARTGAGTAAGTTGMQTRGDAATSGDRTTQSGATAPQTGTKAYGTDVDPNRMRGGTTGQQQGTPRGDATAPQTGTKAYGTDVDPNRMRGGTTGQQQGATGTTERRADTPASSNTTGNPVTNQPGTAGGHGNPPATGGGTGTGR